MLVSVRQAVEEELSSFLAMQSHYLHSISPELAPVSNAITSFLLDSGKRLRPLFAFAGFASGHGQLDKSSVRAMASLELLQACALIHDDLMDGSDTRRGKPSIHRHFETLHIQDALDGFAPQYGLSAAVLLGDLCLVWADQMLNTSGLPVPRLTSLTPIYDEMRVELMAGQFLDIHEQTQKNTDLARSMKIARYKSGKYTIERPLHMGASLSGNSTQKLTAALSEYGLPLGEAFQFRDDLLGVFGDPAVTGKPAGDDLREGKRTALIAMTDSRCTPAMREESRKYFGNNDIDDKGIAILQEIITSTGAKAELEKMIDDLTARAMKAIENTSIAGDAQPLLTELALIATKRSM